MNTKPRIKIGEVTIPGALNTNIIARFMDEQELLKFWEEYANAKLSVGAEVKEPEPEDYVMLKAFFDRKDKGISASVLAKSFGVTTGVFNNRIRRAALWLTMNDLKLADVLK